MRKKLQIGLCILLAVISVGCLLGIWHSQNLKRQEKRIQQALKDKEEESSDWDEDHVIDWDAYFNEGGYFGDYGDESISYPIDRIRGIDIQAEYATVHVKHSEEILDVEVYTQVGDNRDAISCELKDGILTIIQADLDEDGGSDGSYIEVTMPSGMPLESFHLMQKSGAVSLAMNGHVENMVLSMDAGTIMADYFEGKSLSVDINTTNVHVKDVKFQHAQFCVREGVLRVEELDISGRLEVLNTDGSVNAGLVRRIQKYSAEIGDAEGQIELDGELLEKNESVKDEDVPVVLKTQSGSISLETLEEEEE